MAASSLVVDRRQTLDDDSIVRDDVTLGAQHEVAFVQGRRKHNLERELVDWPLVNAIRCVEAPNMRRAQPRHFQCSDQN
jgi:hypothetical protein